MNSRNSLSLYIWIFIGMMLLIFSNSNLVIPLAAWLAPVFIMRYTRKQQWILGLVLGAALCFGAFFITWFPVMKIMNPVKMFILIGASALLYYSAFIIDKIMAPRLNGLLATFVFPLVWTVIEYCRSFIPSVGSFGSIAYSQYGNLPLLQISAVTGIWGLVFLMCWFASIVNFLWENELDWPKIRKELGFFTIILIGVLIYGGARIALNPPQNETVRIAAITLNRTKADLDRIIKDKVFPSLEDYLPKISDLSKKAATSGAKIILWPEYGFQIVQPDEAALLKYSSEIARREKVYLSLGIVVFDKDMSRKGRNKTYLIKPDGKIEWVYHKHHLVDDRETPYIYSGNPILPLIRTPYGKISVAICYDYDFPQYILQTGRGEVDIQLNPALDWKEITPLHTYMAVFRAIENGFSMVKAGGDGLSIAVDYYGNVLGIKNSFLTKNEIMFADLPVKGRRTIYAKIGDLFAWLCIFGLLFVSGLSLTKRTDK